eukprot:76890_1
MLHLQRDVLISLILKKLKKKGKHEFDVTVENRIWSFLCQSEADRNDWCIIIQNICMNIKSQPQPSPVGNTDENNNNQENKTNAPSARMALFEYTKKTKTKSAPLYQCPTQQNLRIQNPLVVSICIAKYKQLGDKSISL